MSSWRAGNLQEQTLGYCSSGHKQPYAEEKERDRERER